MTRFLSFLLILVFTGQTMIFPTDDTGFDLVIINARIIDGTGNPWFRGSIAIKDGRIAKVGRIDQAPTKHVIDAKNQIVAPGFIDVHTHTEDIYKQPDGGELRSHGCNVARDR